MYVIEYGKRSDKSFVLVHGIGVSGRYFRKLADELARNGRVFLLDLPGFGQTAKPSHSLTIGDYAAVVREFIMTHDIPQTVLIGHSMGCQIVAELARITPELTSKIVLIGPVVNEAERTLVRQWLRLMQDGFHEPWSVNFIIQTDYIRCGVPWYFTELKHMINYRIERCLSDVRVPAIIVRGKKDSIVPHVWARRLDEITPHSRLVEFDDAGHVVMYKYPYEIAQLCIGANDEKSR